MQWDITDTVISIHALLAESDLFDEDDPDNLWSISIHALLAESDWQAAKALDRLRISIHALLAESDLDHGIALVPHQHFYPRSPCGERPGRLLTVDTPYIFLSTLSLRRATCLCRPICVQQHYFYPRSPCGERPQQSRPPASRRTNFYPRSPCGERLATVGLNLVGQIFLSTLSLRRATLPICKYGDPLIFLSTLSLRRATTHHFPTLHNVFISIHALLAESDLRVVDGSKSSIISIHALLAESDLSILIIGFSGMVFLSTLSLRRATAWSASKLGGMSISIHALLAESDPVKIKPVLISTKFLSTLSLRRATRYVKRLSCRTMHFYPRSPCGERPDQRLRTSTAPRFLSTLSLRRAT